MDEILTNKKLSNKKRREMIYKPFKYEPIYNKLLEEKHKDVMKLVKNKIYQENNGYKYVLNIIDTFTKYCYCFLLKHKKDYMVAHEFEKIFKNEISPQKLITDGGKEFNNKKCKDIMHEYNVQYICLTGYIHLPIIERLNRTIKHKLLNYINTYNEVNNTKTYKINDILDKIVKEYNFTKHSTINTYPYFIHYQILGFSKTLQLRILRRVQLNILNTKNKINTEIINEYNVGDKVYVKTRKTPSLTDKEKFKMFDNRINLRNIPQ